MPLGVHAGWIVAPLMVLVVLGYLWVVSRILRNPSDFPAPRRVRVRTDRAFESLYALFGIASRDAADWPSRQWEANREEDVQLKRFRLRQRGRRVSTR